LRSLLFGGLLAQGTGFRLACLPIRLALRRLCCATLVTVAQLLLLDLALNRLAFIFQKASLIMALVVNLTGITQTGIHQKFFLALKLAFLVELLCLGLLCTSITLQHLSLCLTLIPISLQLSRCRAFASSERPCNEQACDQTGVQREKSYFHFPEYSKQGRSWQNIR